MSRAARFACLRLLSVRPACRPLVLPRACASARPPSFYHTSPPLAAPRRRAQKEDDTDAVAEEFDEGEEEEEDEEEDDEEDEEEDKGEGEGEGEEGDENSDRSVLSSEVPEFAPPAPTGPLRKAGGPRRPRMSEADATKALTQEEFYDSSVDKGAAGWAWAKRRNQRGMTEEYLARQFKFMNYPLALSFIVRVGFVAEKDKVGLSWFCLQGRLAYLRVAIASSYVDFYRMSHLPASEVLQANFL